VAKDNLLKGLEMSILVVGGALFGMVLGRFFKWFALFPAFGLAVILALANPVHVDNSLLASFLAFVALIVSIQIGYVAGLILHNFLPAPNHPMDLAVRHLGGISAGANVSREPISGAIRSVSD
jgi:hypothetical protein